VHNQIAGLVDLHPAWKLYHYRDKDKREIDFVIDTPDCVVGIEVKASESIGLSAFKHLRWFGKTLITHKPFIGMVLHTGKLTTSFASNLLAIPLSALWSKEQ
jgi:predicted AAA+ superfamily ATPase